jgi:hypothetical protein
MISENFERLGVVDLDPDNTEEGMLHGHASKELETGGGITERRAASGTGLVTDSIGYHPPVAGWTDIYLGRTWRDMQGATNDDKKFNFALFRRGLITLDDMNNPLESWGHRKHPGSMFSQDAGGGS